MANLFDYLNWRGDLSFKTNAFNEVDNLVLAVLSYLDYKGIVPGMKQNDIITLGEVAELFTDPQLRLSPTASESFNKHVLELLEKAATSKRFKDLRMSHYINQVDDEQTKQISAVVFTISGLQHFIAFSGTDDSLVGWKENLQMSFRESVQAQQEAAQYTEDVMRDLPGKFRLGGHSKGGNLAVYAASRVKTRFQRRIVAVYNNDGPGFQTRFTQSEGYTKILDRITTFLPRSSVVGMLLEHREDYKVVSSDESGLLQHDAFSWEVLGPQFVYEDGLSDTSLAFNKAMRTWLDHVDLEEREEFVDALFDILKSTGVKSVSGLSHDKLSKAMSMIKSYIHMQPETQTHLKKVIEIFFEENQSLFKQKIKDDISSLIAKTLPGKKEEAKEGKKETTAEA